MSHSSYSITDTALHIAPRRPRMGVLLTCFISLVLIPIPKITDTHRSPRPRVSHSHANLNQNGITLASRDKTIRLSIDKKPS